MKKFLLSLIALVVTVGLSAQTTVTFDGTGTTFTGDAGAQSETKDGVTLSVSQGLYNGHYRFYKGQTVTVSCASTAITKIEFTCTVSGDTKYGPGCFGEPNVGAYSYDDKIGTWTGNANEINLVASSNQVRATKIVVTLDDASADPTAVAKPTIKPAAGTYYEAKTLTFTSDNDVYYTINGGEAKKYDAANPEVLSAEGTYSIEAWAEKDGNKSDIVKAEIVIKSLVTYTSMADAKAAAEATAVPCKFTFENVVVTAASSNNAFLQDAAGNYGLIYASGHGFKQGDVLNGTVNASIQIYNSALEFTAITATTEGLTVTAGGTPVVTEMLVEDLGTVHYGKLITLKGLKYEGSNNKFSQTTDDDYYVTAYKTFMTLPTFIEGKTYDLTGIALYYKSSDALTLEISPRSEADIKLITNLVAPELNADNAKTQLGIGEEDTYTLNYNGDGAVTVTSSADSIATVSYADGKVTVKGVSKGNATITIAAAEGDDFLQATVSYDLKVVNAGEIAASWVAADEKMDNATNMGTEPYVADSNVSILFYQNANANNEPKYYTTGTAARLYGDNVLEVKVAEGYAVKSVSFKYSGSTYTAKFTPSVGTYTEVTEDFLGSWSDANGLTYQFVQFVVGQTCRIQQVDVIYVKGEPTGESKNILTGISEITAPTAAAAVRYNLAGQRVNANAKGIVIVNGKKVVM